MVPVVAAIAVSITIIRVAAIVAVVVGDVSCGDDDAAGK